MTQMSNSTCNFFQKLTRLSAVCGLLFSTFSASAQVETFYSKNIGNPVSGSATYLCDVEEFTLSAAEAGISGNTDSFQFVYQNQSGDLDVVARIQSNDATFTGLMIRSSDEANSAFAMVALEGNVSTSSFRLNQSESAGSGLIYDSGNWLRIRREGQLISCLVSSDGNEWLLLASRSVNLGNNVLVGLATESGEVSYRDFSISSTIETIAIVVPEDPDPIDPVDPIDPIDPVDPVDPVDPIDPVDSGPIVNDGETFNVDRIGQGTEADGTASYDAQSEVFTLTATGGKTWGKADDFEYVYREITGDVEVTVNVSDLLCSNPYAKGGIMFRQTTATDSLHAFLSVSCEKGVALERRRQIAGGTQRSAKGNVQAPVWLRLIKEGTYLHAYYSLDGDNWNFLSEDIIEFGDPILVGLAVAAQGEGETVSADFENLSIVSLDADSGSETLISADIGRVGVNGDAAYDPTTDSFIVEASGGDIGATADAFHYVYREVTGDFIMEAYLDNLIAASDWAKAGLMARQDYRPDSPYFAAFMANNIGILYQSRAVQNDHTDWSRVDGISTPVWLRISRIGNEFTAEFSFNGTDWSTLGQKILNFSDTLLLGMALTSHEEGALAYGEFSNVTITQD